MLSFGPGLRQGFAGLRRNRRQEQYGGFVGWLHVCIHAPTLCRLNHKTNTDEHANTRESTLRNHTLGTGTLPPQYLFLYPFPFPFPFPFLFLFLFRTRSPRTTGWLTPA